MPVASFYIAHASPRTAQAYRSAAYMEPPLYLPRAPYQWCRGGGVEYPRPFIKLYRVRLFINPSSVRQRCQYQWHAAHVDTLAHNMSLDALFNSTCEPADRASKLVGGLHGAARQPSACDVEVTPRRGPGATCTGGRKFSTVSLPLARYIYQLHFPV